MHWTHSFVQSVPVIPVDSSTYSPRLLQVPESGGGLIISPRLVSQHPSHQNSPNTAYKNMTWHFSMVN